MRLLMWTKVTYGIKGCTTKSVLLTGCKTRTHSWITQTCLQGYFKATGKTSSRLLGAGRLPALPIHTGEIKMCCFRKIQNKAQTSLTCHQVPSPWLSKSSWHVPELPLHQYLLKKTPSFLFPCLHCLSCPSPRPTIYSSSLNEPLLEFAELTDLCRQTCPWWHLAVVTDGHNPAQRPWVRWKGQNNTNNTFLTWLELPWFDSPE